MLARPQIQIAAVAFRRDRRLARRYAPRSAVGRNRKRPERDLNPRHDRDRPELATLVRERHYRQSVLLNSPNRVLTLD